MMLQFAVLATVLSLASATPDEFLLPVRMPNIRNSSGVNEMYLCTYVPVPEDGNLYFVTGFEPMATMSNVHHMLGYACDEPGMMSTPDQQAVWACGHDPLEGKLYPDFGVCTGSTNALLYAWARNAKSIELPKGVGFEVGGNTGRKYLVVQVHYMNLDKDFDTSGVEFRMTKQEQPMKAGVIIMGHMSTIPPQSTIFLETSCQLPSDVRIHPISFRTHTHNLGRVVSGYKVSESKDKWTLIGKKDPRLPQMFYPVDDPNLVINGGEYLAARFTMVSNRTTVTQMGATNEYEMCNYYIMYYIDPKESRWMEPTSMHCWTNDPHSWSKIFSNIPEDASEIDGIRYQETSP